MKTVACVLRSGGVYTPTWVQKLKHAVSKNLSADHRFVCLSDTLIDGVDTLGLRHEWPRWWSKIELFDPKLFSGPVLYLDLDVIITGPLDDLFTQSGFYMCEDFLRPEAKNSSVMAWCGDYSEIYDSYRVDPTFFQTRYDRQRPNGRIGDQAFIEDRVEAQTFPVARVVSYRKHARHFPPDRASVVAFHGRPKPPDAKGWASEWWNAL